MAQADVDEILANQPKDLPDVNWDDPKAVAAARGDAKPTGDRDVTEGTRSTAQQVAREQAQAQKQDKQDQDKPDKGQARQAKQDKGQDKDHRIPKSRFDEVNQRAKTAESENETLKAQLAKFEARDELLRQAEERKAHEDEQRRAFDEHTARLDKVDELEGKFTELVSENKLDEAKKVRREISKLEREIVRDEINATSLDLSEQTREQVAYDAVVTRLESAHPEFDPGNKDKYDQELVDTVMALSQGYQVNPESPLTPSQALIKAVKTIMPSTQGKKGLSESRKQQAIERGLDAAAKQGADHDGLGADADEAGMSDQIDFSKLTEKDLEAMPESALKRARGDFV